MTESGGEHRHLSGGPCATGRGSALSSSWGGPLLSWLTAGPPRPQLSGPHWVLVLGGGVEKQRDECPEMHRLLTDSFGFLTDTRGCRVPASATCQTPAFPSLRCLLVQRATPAGGPGRPHLALLPAALPPQPPLPALCPAAGSRQTSPQRPPFVLSSQFQAAQSSPAPQLAPHTPLKP